MPKLPRTSSRKIIAALKHMGFIEVRTKGSHVVLKKATPEGVFGCVVPLHEEVAVGTLHKFVKASQC